jgi:superfamily I DNA and RNA helicase
MAKKDWMVVESELDEDQIRVLMATLDKSCVVSGCAGSGKSVLALIKAQRIQKEKGDNYKIIVFTKALCRYMNAGKKILGLRNCFELTKTFISR